MVRIFGVSIGRKKPPQATNLTASFREEDAELKVILKELRAVDYVLSYITETDKSKADLTLSLLKGLLNEGDLPKANEMVAILETVDMQRNEFKRVHRRGLFRRGKPESFSIDRASNEYQLLIEICIGLIEFAKRHDVRVMAIVNDILKRESARNTLPESLQAGIYTLKWICQQTFSSGRLSGRLTGLLEDLIRELKYLQNPSLGSYDVSWFGTLIHNNLSRIITRIGEIFKIKGQFESHLHIKI